MEKACHCCVIPITSTKKEDDSLSELLTMYKSAVNANEIEVLVSVDGVILFESTPTEIRDYSIDDGKLILNRNLRGGRDLLSISGCILGKNVVRESFLIVDDVPAGEDWRRHCRVGRPVTGVTVE